MVAGKQIFWKRRTAQLIHQWALLKARKEAVYGRGPGGATGPAGPGARMFRTQDGFCGTQDSDPQHGFCRTRDGAVTQTRVLQNPRWALKNPRRAARQTYAGPPKCLFLYKINTQRFRHQGQDSLWHTRALKNPTRALQNPRRALQNPIFGPPNTGSAEPKTGSA